MALCRVTASSHLDHSQVIGSLRKSPTDRAHTCSRHIAVRSPDQGLVSAAVQLMTRVSATGESDVRSLSATLKRKRLPSRSTSYAIGPEAGLGTWNNFTGVPILIFGPRPSMSTAISIPSCET